MHILQKALLISKKKARYIVNVFKQFFNIQTKKKRAQVEKKKKDKNCGNSYKRNRVRR